MYLIFVENSKISCFFFDWKKVGRFDDTVHIPDAALINFYNKKTRKATGVMVSATNCLDITQVIKKREMSTTVSKILKSYLIQSYLLRR